MHLELLSEFINNLESLNADYAEFLNYYQDSLALFKMAKKQIGLENSPNKISTQEWHKFANSNDSPLHSQMRSLIKLSLKLATLKPEIENRIKVSWQFEPMLCAKILKMHKNLDAAIDVDIENLKTIINHCNSTANKVRTLTYTHTLFFDKENLDTRNRKFIFKQVLSTFDGSKQYDENNSYHVELFSTFSKIMGKSKFAQGLIKQRPTHEEFCSKIVEYVLSNSEVEKPAVTLSSCPN